MIPMELAINQNNLTDRPTKRIKSEDNQEIQPLVKEVEYLAERLVATWK